MRLGGGHNPWWGPFLIFLVGILYLTLYPFHFVLLPWSDIWARIDWHLPWGPGHHSRLDIWSNLLLFVPLGLSLGQLLKRYSWPLRIVLVYFFALGLSSLIEGLQVFLPERDPALIDVFCNTCGAVLGALGGRLFHVSLKTRHRQGLVYLGTAFFLLYTPFYFTADWGEIKTHLKHLAWHLSFPNMLLPALFVSLASLHLFGGGRVGFGALCVATLLELGRILVLPVTLNPVKAWGRIGLAVFFALFWQRIPRPVVQRAVALFCLGGAFLLEAWYPFKLNFPSLSTSSFLPFFYYLTHLTKASLFHLLEVVFFFLSWGLLAREVCSVAMLFSGAIGLVLLTEIGQAFVEGRIPDFSSVFLAALGVWLAQKLFPEGTQDDL